MLACGLHGAARSILHCAVMRAPLCVHARWRSAAAAADQTDKLPAVLSGDHRCVAADVISATEIISVTTGTASMSGDAAKRCLLIAAATRLTAARPSSSTSLSCARTAIPRRTKSVVRLLLSARRTAARHGEAAQWLTLRTRQRDFVVQFGHTEECAAWAEALTVWAGLPTPNENNALNISTSGASARLAQHGVPRSEGSSPSSGSPFERESNSEARS